ncbi:hypothetical protein B0A49_00056 [Cryomyces minteri]|uniref:Fungal N-terminal domain-containing protein n=1 Tax=Cryomyces minteri TaxID=331657 RepID=A0A4U0Y156_9PEZI|nr:hypothetical protein B0A49_00056 [Cryomyces minteri]
MAGAPSIGDILMLSQTAWKVGRAFTSGRKGAPAEFQEVESEANGLSKALTLLGEILLADDSILARADAKSREGVVTILHSCEQTLEDLESFVDQYKIIKRTETNGGYTVERNWSELVLSNYKRMKWTTEGGDIQALRNMLQMHTSTINLTMQALQSGSLSRLEETIMPMAQKVDDVHNRLNGDLGDKIEDVHRVVMAVVNGTPIVRPRVESVQDAPSVEIAQGQRQSVGLLEAKCGDVGGYNVIFWAALCFVHTAAYVWIGRVQGSLGRLGDIAVRTSARVRPEGDESPTLSDPILPPPAIAPDPDPEIGTTHALLAQSFGLEPVTQEQSFNTSLEQSLGLELAKITTAQQEIFEASLFRNSATLCDLRGTLVEYTQPISAKGDDAPSAEFEMVKAASKCRICVVRKVDSKSEGGVGVLRTTTSIWVFSEDHTIRLQQKLADNNEELVPFSSYFQPSKVSLTVPATLRFHAPTFGAKPDHVAKTSRVNYVFADVRSATLFQSVLFGRQLIGIYKTEKTLRIHEGLKGALAFQEQLCAMENLRLWQDEQSGGVLAMIHFCGSLAAALGTGYMTFYLNSSKQPVRAKDEGGKTVRLKGLNVVVVDPRQLQRRDSGGKQKPGNRITGARVEFAGEDEKRHFLALLNKVQEKMIVLPELH